MRKSITTGIIVSLCFAGTAFAEVQDKEQQKCINSLNKGMAKVSKTQLKADTKCISDFAKGKNASAQGCYLSSTKVTTAQDKNCDAATKKCTTAPTLGPTGCGDVNNYSEYNGSEFASDVLNQVNPDNGVTLCESDKPGCKCQAAALKSATKLYSTYQKVFNTCKKKGLKDKTAPFDDITDIEACLSGDPKNKISKAAAKLTSAIGKKCVDAGVATPFALGDCAGLSGALLASCLETEVRCRVCITALGSDNLTLNCDLYDEGSVEGSCNDDF
jgi:hypothetical protein